MSIFSHITLGVNDLERSIRFYDVVLSILGLERHSSGDTFAGYGPPPNAQDSPSHTGENSLWILKPQNEEVATGGNGTNIALIAGSQDMVDAFYTTSIEHGAICEGEPGLRAEAHDHFYACYVRDYDGNKIIAVCHKPQ